METEAMPVNNLTYSFTLRPKDGLTHSMDGEYTYDPKKEVTELEQLFKSDTPLYI